MDKEKLIDLTKQDAQFEMASVRDADLMKILCFATHEGENLNGTIFPPKILVNCYRTFIDKPVVVVPDKFNNPTGHGFDYNKQEFQNDKRINVGHIVNAYPVVILENGEMYEIWDVSDLDNENLKDGELRIVAELVIYKHYLYDIAERLKFLHEVGNLSFSMEAVVDAYTTEDGGKVCTDISFTGLAIVDKPAFVRAKSIEVAGQKEDEEAMEFKEMYEAEKAKNESLIAEKAVVDEELENTKTELASVKEELANSKAEVASVKAEVEALKPYKEKVEVAEKEALGKERVAKLEKFGIKDLDAMELAEMSKDEFADKLIEAAENMKIEVAEENQNGVIGVPVHNTGMKSDFDKLAEIFKGL